MYILKMRGIHGNTDYIQIRDENFTLVAYFRSGNLHRALSNAGLLDYEEKIKNILSFAEYGKIIKLN